MHHGSTTEAPERTRDDPAGQFHIRAVRRKVFLATAKVAGQLSRGGHPIVHGRRATPSAREAVAAVRLADAAPSYIWALARLPKVGSRAETVVALDRFRGQQRSHGLKDIGSFQSAEHTRENLARSDASGAVENLG